MRKWLICIFCVCMLSACHTGEKKGGEVNAEQKGNALKEDIHQITSMNMIGGTCASNEHGYYYLTQFNEETSGVNIKYIDYESKKEVYLCNKPNCKHDNEECTSFMPYSGMGVEQMYLDGEHLYLLYPTLNSNDAADGLSFSDSSDIQYKMYMMDLNGSNRKITGELKENEEIQSTCFSQAQYIYVVVEETKEDKSVDKKLIRLDGISGKREVLQDMNDMVVDNAYKNQLIIKKSDYYALRFDENSTVSEMQSASAAATVELQLFDVEKKSSVTLISKPFNDFNQTNVANDGLYYNAYKGNQLFRIDLKTKKDEIVYDNLRNASVGYLDDNHLKLEFYDDKGVNEQLVSAELLDLTTLETIPLEFTIAVPRTYVDVIAANKDKFLVISDYDASDEYLSYFNVTQTEIRDEYLSLIDKEDYYNQQFHFQSIDRGDRSNAGN